MNYFPELYFAGVFCSSPAGTVNITASIMNEQNYTFTIHYMLSCLISIANMVCNLLLMIIKILRKNHSTHSWRWMATPNG